MKVDTRTLRQHTAVFTAEDIKAVALPAVARQLAIAESDIVSSSADVLSDGSITVVIVEAAGDAAGAPSLNTGDAGTAPQDPSIPQIPGAPVIAPN